MTTTDLKKLHEVWLESRAYQSTDFPKISFDELTNAIVSTGPFYYYVIDFYQAILLSLDAEGRSGKSLAFMASLLS